jgi:hypothetical protein
MAEQDDGDPPVSFHIPILIICWRHKRMIPVVCGYIKWKGIVLEVDCENMCGKGGDHIDRDRELRA